MLIVSWLIVISHVLAFFFGPAVPEEAWKDDTIATIFLGVFLVNCSNIVIHAIVIFGAGRMLKLQDYRLAMTAAVLSMFPCGACFLVSLPVGIWAMVVLFDDDVKDGFRS